MENKSNPNSTVLSVYRTWLNRHENAIGTITEYNTLITQELIDLIKNRLNFLMNGEQKNEAQS